MRMKTMLGWWLAVTSQALPAAQAAGPAVRGSSVEASAFAAAPKIDGRLDEEVWRGAARIDAFTQAEPEAGAPSSEQTEVLVGYDEDKLYLGVRCLSEEVVSSLMERDVDIQNEDSVQFVLDTFDDGSNGFFFAVTAAGAQVDALVRSDGDDVNYNWDGIWDSATSVDEGGWTAELAIPFRTLRFPAAERQSWGFNVHRVSIHKREYVLWQRTDLPLAFKAIFKVSQAGRLEGLEGIRQGRSWDLLPYVLARVGRSDEEGDDEDFEVGLDVKKNLSPELTLDLTYNLDFAETEIDAQQTNLTRFKLFFPEKRDFFLEGANLFYFGERSELLRPSEKIFFFSRRIGLSDDADQAIPVLGGVKLSGKLAGTDVGLMNLTTEELTYRTRGGEMLTEPETNFSVLRLKRNVLRRSSLGLIWLNKEVRGGTDTSGAGLDWDFGLTKHLRTGGFVAKTETPGTSGSDEGAFLSDLVYESDSLFLRGSYTDVGRGFNPEMGFFKRTGIREWHESLIRIVRPKKGAVRSFYLVQDFDRITGEDGELETQTGHVEFDFYFHNWSGVFFKAFDNVEVLKSGFEIHPGVVIPAGRYEFTNYFFGWQANPGKRFFPFGRFHFGDFYDGRFDTVILGMRTRPRKGLFSRLFLERTHVDLPAGEFTIEFASLNVTYSSSPTLSGRAIVQWRSDDNFSANLSVKWIYKPGAAFYVVYNELRDLLPRPGELPDPKDRSLTVKTIFYF